MNEEPLDKLIHNAVDRVRGQGTEPTDTDRVVDEILQDPDLALLMKGVREHDRSEGLEDVYRRDIRRKVASYLSQSDQQSETQP
jgi:hypothetical protein